MNSNRNNPILLILTSLGILVGCETFNDHPTTMRNFISQNQCHEAEAYANRNFREDYLDWMLGNIALSCRKNRRAAIEYYKAGARANSQYSNLSVRALIELGETPPTPIIKYVTNPAQPAVQQQIIIQQPQQQIMNPNACIQDGGPIFCPKYPRRN